MCQKLTCQLAACLMCCQCSYFHAPSPPLLFFPFLPGSASSALIFWPISSWSTGELTFLCQSAHAGGGCWQRNRLTQQQEDRQVESSVLWSQGSEAEGVLEKHRPTPGSIKRQKIWGQSSAISCQSQTPTPSPASHGIFIRCPLGFS